MSFPLYQAWPSELPLFRLDGHSFEDVGVAADGFAFERGEDRQRSRYTINARIVTVSSVFTLPEYDRFVDFCEGELVAAAGRFDVRVADEMDRLGAAWWSAQFVGPPRETPLNGGKLWLIEAELLLTDGPYATRTAPGLMAELVTTTALRGVAEADPNMRDTVGVDTALSARFTDQIVHALLALDTELTATFGESPAARVLESGAARVTEGGVPRVLERAP
jgi:hypothetical protein